MTDDNENKNEYTEENSEAERKIKKLRKILKRYKSERQEYLEGWQRSRADHQNYIKQKDAELQEFRKFVSTDILLKMIPIFDNLIIAGKSMPPEISDSAWAKGILGVQRQVEAALFEYGVREIAIKRGDKFDPAYAEAIEETEDTGESGTIAEVLQKGYMIRDKIIRAARVKVIK